MRASLLNLDYLLPEWIVCGTILVLILSYLLGTTDRRRLADLSALGLVTALFFSVVTFFEPAVVGRVSIGNGLLQVDPFSQLFKVLFLVSTLAAVLYSAGSVEIHGKRWMEFNCFLLGVTSGMMFLASSMNLMMVYLSFEMMSLSSYVLAGYTRGDPRSTEAGYKYVLFGAVSSGVMLFGLSLMYGLLGTLDMGLMAQRTALAQFPDLHLLLLPLTLVFVGLGYKIAFFPFHYWAPDVYEGSPTPVTAFFSVGTKAAGLALLLRLLLGTLSLDQTQAIPWAGDLLAFLAAMTMTVGNLAALNQANIKRMLAYSAIAHAGYMLMGVAVLNVAGAEAVLFYLFAYMFTNLGAFTVVVALFNLYQSEQVDELTGMGKLFPLASVCMAICLFSLTGLPPTAGFIGKFYVFAAVIQKGYFVLALVGAINTAISLFYYMRIMKAFYFREPKAEMLAAGPMPCGYNVLIASLTVPVLIFGICWSRLYEYCSTSISSLIAH
ncbi:MAG: NADH-quinone oxidoreductase subunit N [Candidatus Wallbacteria bacterium]|nr:NADH-quinone oxidoreductase subunit N [Candidatus Wallbacteria bacterium]